MSKWGSSCRSCGELGDKRKVLCSASPPPLAISSFHLLKTLFFFHLWFGVCFTIAWILHGGQALGWGGGCVCTESIQGVVISAFHFAVQLERSRFQIHPHTGTAREESAGEGGSCSRGMGQHGRAGAMAWALGALANLSGSAPQPLSKGRRCLCPVSQGHAGAWLPCECLWLL